MIILGDRYRFTPYELARLEKRVKNIMYISRENHDDTEIIDRLKDLIALKKPDYIVLNISKKPSNELIKFLTAQELNNIRFLTFEHFMERFLEKCYISQESDDLSYLENIHPFNFFEYTVKRAIDIASSIILLTVSFPVMIYSALKIKKESPGSIFFKQKRVGLKGKLFTCYKFRSMNENCHFDPYTREDDKRIFSFGDFMRKTRIDELPQLFNVIKGDMHLIGPRAEWHILVEEYEKELPYYRERHLVRPGITGWAQVNYPYGQNIEDTRQKLMYDLYYIKYWNLWIEIKTIFKTIAVVLKKRGT